ncbi:MAG: hypothetical protein AAF184_25375 [Pseudomonadota bacterium]
MRMVIGSVLLGLAASAHAQVPQCFCEHFGSQYDQVCEAGPAQVYNKVEGGPSAPQYEYQWSTDPGGMITGQNPEVPIAYADCVNGFGCTLIVYVEIWWNPNAPRGKSTYLGRAQCGSGTGGGL